MHNRFLKIVGAMFLPFFVASLALAQPQHPSGSSASGGSATNATLLNGIDGAGTLSAVMVQSNVANATVTKSGSTLTVRVGFPKTNATFVDTTLDNPTITNSTSGAAIDISTGAPAILIQAPNLTGSTDTGNGEIQFIAGNDGTSSGVPVTMKIGDSPNNYTGYSFSLFDGLGNAFRFDNDGSIILHSPSVTVQGVLNLQNNQILNPGRVLFPAGVTFSGGVTNTSLTASALKATDANKKEVSLFIGSGLSSDGTTLTATGGGGGSLTVKTNSTTANASATTLNTSNMSATASGSTVTLIPIVLKKYSVRDYGAVGDGVTDDAPAFQRAITALVQTNAYSRSVLLASGGPYLLASSIVFPKINAGASSVTNWNFFGIEGDVPPTDMLGTIAVGAFDTNSGTTFLISNKAFGSVFSSVSGDNPTFPFNMLTVEFKNISFVEITNNGTVLNFTNIQALRCFGVNAHPKDSAMFAQVPHTNSMFSDYPDFNSALWNIADHVTVQRYANAMRAGEHFSANELAFLNNSNALVFKSGNFGCSIKHIYTSQNNHGIRDLGLSCKYKIDNWEIERGAGPGSAWQTIGWDDITGGSTAALGMVNFTSNDTDDATKSNTIKIGSGACQHVQFYNIALHSFVNTEENILSPLGAFASRGPVFAYCDDSARVGGLTVSKSEGTTYAQTAVSSGNGGGSLFFGSYDGSTVVAPASIRIKAVSTASGGNAPSDLEFYTGTNDTTQTANVIIRSTGETQLSLTTNAAPSNVTIGITTPDKWFLMTNQITGVRFKVPGWSEH